MNPVIQNSLIWLSNKDNFLFVCSVLSTAYLGIEKIKATAGKNTREKISNFVKNEAPRLINENLTSPEKKEILQNKLYDFLSKKELKRVSEKEINMIVEGTYHAEVKPKITND